MQLWRDSDIGVDWITIAKMTCCKKSILGFINENRNFFYKKKIYFQNMFVIYKSGLDNLQKKSIDYIANA